MDKNYLENRYLVTAYFLFAAAVLMNYISFSDLPFGVLILPHQVDLMQHAAFWTLVLFLIFVFFTKQNQEGFIFGWAAVLSGASFLRYTISDDILFILIGFMLVLANPREFWPLPKKGPLFLIISFMLYSAVMAAIGLANSGYSIRFLILYVAILPFFILLSRKSDEEISDVVSAAYWPCIAYLILTISWWTGMYYNYPSLYSSTTSVWIGSLEGIGYAGTSHKELPMLVLMYASLVRYARSSNIWTVSLALMTMLLFVLFSDSRFATLIFVGFYLSLTIISSFREKLKITLLLIIFTLILFPIIGFKFSGLLNYIEGFYRILESSTETITYAYRGTVIETQKGDIGRITFLLVGVKFILREFPTSFFGCGLYSFYTCAADLLNAAGYVKFVNPTIGGVTTWSSEGITRAPFLPSLMVERGLVGTTLLASVAALPFFPILSQFYSGLRTLTFSHLMNILTLRYIMFLLIYLAISLTYMSAGYVGDIPVFFLLIFFMSSIAKTIFAPRS